MFPVVKCVACGKEADLDGRGLCADCADWLEENRGAYKKRCVGCAVYAPFRYEEAAAGLVRNLKFGGVRMCAQTLGEAAGMLALREAIAFDIIVPVPLSRKRMRERGFNQSRQIAVYIAQICEKPCAPDALARVRDTKRQSELAFMQRHENVENAFLAKDVEGKRVLLVDDVFTTGATCGACIAALREAGVSMITVLCATMAGQDGQDERRGRSSRAGDA